MVDDVRGERKPGYYVGEILNGEIQAIMRLADAEDGPSGDYFRFLGTNRKRYLRRYIGTIARSLMEGDSTDFLGTETFESYKCAKHGIKLTDVIQMPMLIRSVSNIIIEKRIRERPEESIKAVTGKKFLDELLDRAMTIRSQSYCQTKEETIKFFHSSQEEIDSFPSNLAAIMDIDTLLASATRELTKMLRARDCVFLEREIATDMLYVLSSNFEHELVFGQGGIELDEEISQGVIREGNPHLVEEREQRFSIISSLMKRLETRVLLFVPLKVRGRTVGVVMLDSEEKHPFSPDQIELAGRFCNQVAAAMENARMHQNEQKKIKETLALFEIARLMNSTLDVDTLLSRVAQITVDLSEVKKCSVYLAVEGDNRFYPAASHSEDAEMDWETSIGDGVGWKDLCDEEARALLSGSEVWITDPEMSPFIPEGMAERFGIKSLLVIPMQSRGTARGLVVFFCTSDAVEVEEEWSSLCNAIVGQASVALDNVSLYEKIERSYYSTVMALARAIEVKDPYTYGHSEEVTNFAMAIGRRMGLDPEELLTLKYGATLHDVGKIGISGKVLNKPGALTDEEYLHVKTHPQLGEQIVSPVEFLQDPRPIILHHHERYDGRGYPEGLEGDDIPLLARIVAVADAFEAMLSDRPYRKALPIEEAILELKSNSGSQFDPNVVKVFIEVLEERRMESSVMAEEKPAHDSPSSIP